jgi:hypothetical protein
MTKYPNPKIGLVHLDSCAFDPKYHPEDEASKKIFQLYDNNEINLLIAHSTMKEIDHPNTPDWVKNQALIQIFTINTALTKSEETRKNKIASILRGNSKTDKHQQDADHIFEASKYGGRYFVTTDKRILNKKNKYGRFVR